MNDDPTQLTICKKHFPHSQFVECDLRQELYFEYQTFIDEWYKTIGYKLYVSTHYERLRSFLYESAKNTKDQERIIFLHWIDCILISREAQRKPCIVPSGNNKVKEFLYDIYYDLNHVTISPIHSLINVLFKNITSVAHAHASDFDSKEQLSFDNLPPTFDISNVSNVSNKNIHIPPAKKINVKQNISKKSVRKSKFKPKKSTKKTRKTKKSIGKRKTKK